MGRQFLSALALTPVCEPPPALREHRFVQTDIGCAIRQSWDHEFAVRCQKDNHKKAFLVCSGMMYCERDLPALHPGSYRSVARVAHAQRHSRTHMRACACPPPPLAKDRSTDGIPHSVPPVATAPQAHEGVPFVGKCLARPLWRACFAPLSPAPADPPPQGCIERGEGIRLFKSWTLVRLRGSGG